MWNFLLLVFLTAGRIFCEGRSNHVMEPPRQFSDSYSTKGTLYIPYAEISEPFYAWFDLQNGSSRIDYYGGMVKTFQLAKPGESGKSYKVAPVTKDEAQNVETCFSLQGLMPMYVHPQSVLPDISQFEYAGEDHVNGIPCHKWSLISSYGDKVNRYTMWTRSKKSWKSKGQDTAIPVRYEMKGFNTLMGSHYDHYYLDYDWYSPETPASEVFSVANYSCQRFPGPAIDHVYTFNPMKEFVDNHDKHVQAAFEDFKQTHGKNYDSHHEHVRRFELFRQNLRFIHSHNRAGRSFTLAVNHLADKDDLEMRALRGNRYNPNATTNAQSFPYDPQHVHALLKDLPESLDWRLNGAVTPVKDQSVCGSCWSFGATGAVEGAYFLKHGKLLRFSQQALVDCSWGEGNNGCDGGEDYMSYDWIQKNGGIPTEDAYGPYLGQDGFCHVNKSMEVGTIAGYVQVPPNDPAALKVALAVHGPISIAIDASHKSFSFYSNGVYYEPDCNRNLGLDHAVLLVGYGKLNGEDYWLVKNSWSTYWGNDGYVLMAVKDNNCGVTSDATYVKM